MPRKRLFSLLAILTLLISLTIAIPVVHGDGDGPEGFSVPEKQEQQYPNLGSHLNQLVATVEQGSLSPQQAAAESPIHSAESVAVTIHLSGNVDDVVDFLEDNGGDPRNVGENYIETYVPLTLLGRLSEQLGVIRVQEIIPPQDAYGNVISQGVALHGAPAWHQDGSRGQGVKVGIIDSGVGFQGYSSLIGTELPAPTAVRCYTEVGRFTTNLADCEVPGPQGSVHGTAVAEAVIDVAPEVSLYLGSPASPGDWGSVVDWMVGEGVSVIAHSEGSTWDGPGNGTSPFFDSPLRAVDDAVNGGIIYVNSAGNAARETWFKSGPSLVLDSDGYVEFDPSQTRNCFSLTPRLPTVTAELRWDDTWEGATRDLNLYLVDPTSGYIISVSEHPQSGESDHFPYERLRAEYLGEDEATACLEVKQLSGSKPGWVQLRNFGASPDLGIQTISGSIGSPAESANPGLLAVEPPITGTPTPSLATAARALRPTGGSSPTSSVPPVPRQCHIHPVLTHLEQSHAGLAALARLRPTWLDWRRW